jgi:hypothetical protein
MHVLTRTGGANGGPRPRHWCLCLLAAFLLAWLGVPAACGEGPAPPSLEEIARVMDDQWAKVQSLYVDFELSGKPTGDVANIRRYLLLDFLVTQRKTNAFKGQMRYYRSVGPATVERIAPDVEHDWDVIPGGKQIKAEQDRRLAENEKRFGKEVMEKVKKAAAEQKVATIAAELVGAFDGKVYRVTGTKDQIQIWTPENIGTDGGWIHQEYLRNIGRMLPDTANPKETRVAQRFPDALRAKQGFQVEATMEEVDGNSCAVVARGNEEKLWLDPAVNYGIRRQELYDPESGLATNIYHNQDFAEVIPGVWLPKECSWERCAPPGAPPALRGKPLVRFQFAVSRIGVNNVPDDLFSLKIAPGTLVMDTTLLPPKEGHEQLVTYPMPADETKLAETIRRAVEEKQQYESKNFWQKVLIWGNAGAVVLIGGALVYLRLRRRKARSDEGKTGELHKAGA